jgi:dolichol-phosphate mannosyltransferase
MNKLISIVIPAYNEEDVVDELKKRLQNVMNLCSNYNFEVIIVENGSHDNTYNKLIAVHNEDNRFKVIQLSRNFGSDGGILAGLRYSRGAAIIIMCADLQDPPELIIDFLKKWEEGYDIVYGIIKTREGVSVTRKFNSFVAYKLINVLSNNQIPENVSEFRLIDKKVLTAFNSLDEKNKYIRGLMAWTGFKQTGIIFERPPRFAGESKADFVNTVKFALNGIFSFSNFPLYIAAILGFVLSITAGILIIYELSLYLAYGRVVPGFTSLIVVMLFLFSMLFLVVGILGVYIARIYEEVMHRPDYIVNNELGFE